MVHLKTKLLCSHTFKVCVGNQSQKWYELNNNSFKICPVSDRMFCQQTWTKANVSFPHWRQATNTWDQNSDFQYFMILHKFSSTVCGLRNETEWNVLTEALTFVWVGQKWCSLSGGRKTKARRDSSSAVTRWRLLEPEQNRLSSCKEEKKKKQGKNESFERKMIQSLRTPSLPSADTEEERRSCRPPDTLHSTPSWLSCTTRLRAQFPTPQ